MNTRTPAKIITAIYTVLTSLADTHRNSNVTDKLRLMIYTVVYTSRQVSSTELHVGPNFVTRPDPEKV